MVIHWQYLPEALKALAEVGVQAGALMVVMRAAIDLYRRNDWLEWWFLISMFIGAAGSFFKWTGVFNG